MGSSAGAAAAPPVLGAQELTESWNPRIAWAAWPRVPEEREKTSDPCGGRTWRETQPFPEASSPPSQDRALAKPSGPSPHPWQRAEKGWERGDKAGMGEGEPCQVVQVVILAQPLSLCLGTATSPEQPLMLDTHRGFWGGSLGCPVLGLSPPTPQD